MKKNDIRKIFSILNEDDFYKEEFLDEMQEAIFYYIKNGIKSRKIEKFEELEIEFKKIYGSIENQMELNINRMMSQNYERMMQYLIILQKEQKSFDYLTNDKGKNFFEYIDRSKAFDYEDIRKIIDDVTFSTYVYILYQICDIEEKIRLEQKEYDKLTQKYKELPKIVNILNEVGVENPEKIRIEARVEIKDFENIINECIEFFDIQEYENEIDMSLSNKGKEYNSYEKKYGESKYSQETMEQIVYKNCYEILNSLEKIEDNEQIEFKDLSKEREEILQSKYIKIYRNMKSNQESNIIKIIDDCDEERDVLSSYGEEYLGGSDYDIGENDIFR